MLSFLKSLLGGDGPAFAIISPEEAAQRSRKKGEILVDVRNPGEWASGIARDAKTISLQDASMANKVYELAGENLDTPVMVICRSGMRSSQAAKILMRAGFTDVANVRGGMMAWESANLPTSASKS